MPISMTIPGGTTRSYPNGATNSDTTNWADATNWAQDVTNYLNNVAGGSAGPFAIKANNLSDLASASTARTNLGLGGAAVLNVGKAASTVAAGDDSRIIATYSASQGSTLTLTSSSNSRQIVNPTTAINVDLPLTATIGDVFEITNTSTTYLITIRVNNATAVTTVFDGTIKFEATSSTPTTASDWKIIGRYWNPMHFHCYGTPTNSGTNPVGLIYPSKASDTHSLYNTTTGVITIPKNGYYAFSISANTSANNSQFSINSSISNNSNQSLGWTATGTGSGSGTFKLATGTYYIVFGASSPTYSAGNSFSMNCVGEY